MTLNKNKLRRDDLLWGNYQLYQDPQGFCFSLDAVLLACFCPVYPQAKILDAATGNGVLPLLLLAREPELKITGIELHRETAKLAAFNMAVNKAAITIRQGDMMNAAALFPRQTFDRIIANPPYFKKGSARLGKNPAKNLAKVELAWNTPEFFHQCGKILQPEGVIATSYPSCRHDEVEDAALQAGFQETHRAWLKTAPNSEPYLVLSLWRQEHQANAIWEDVMLICQSDGSPSPTVQAILKEKTWRD